MMDKSIEEKIAASEVLIRENAKRARTQARADLLEHLGKLVNGSDASDFIFVCKDGVQVKACRMFLAGRCPVFDSMLTNGMLESNSSVINLPEIPVPALLAILEYLYTGNIAEHQPKCWQTGLEIISAAHFFLLPTVDKIVEECIMAQIPKVSEDLHEAVTMLTAAMTFKCLSHDENAAILQLVNLLESRWMHSDFACQLSEEALHFILKHTKPKFNSEDHLDTTSLEEYFRFRGIVVWCMCNTRSASNEEVDKLITEAIPIAGKGLYCKGVKDLSSMEVAWLPEYSGTHAQEKILQSLQSHGVLESAIRLLAHIDWLRVPPVIFVKIVEPMKLVPDSCLLDTFRFHSLHRLTSMPLRLKWAHNGTYSVRNGGLIIRMHDSSSGSALCQLANCASDDYCKWRFIVKVTGSPSCEFGFVCSKRLENLCRTWNFQDNCIQAAKERSTALGVVQWNTGALSFAGHGGDLRFRNPYHVQSATTLEFQYCRSRQNCAVTVDGKQLGVVWAGLPTTGVFPILSFKPSWAGQNCGGQVELNIVSGFEIF